MTFLFIVLAIVGTERVQTSWYQGAGEPGPVLDWGAKYYASENITHAVEGQISLTSSGVNYGAWTKHIIEANGNIEVHTIGLIPVDIDKDGDMDIPAIIGGSENQVVWYERDSSGNYVKHAVGPITCLNDGISVWPSDLDADGDTDIIASSSEGLIWFENGNLGADWQRHVLDTSMGFVWSRPGDVDNDGDIDIVTHDKMIPPYSYFGDLYLFRNDGNQNFTRELIYEAQDTLYEIWRLHLADFNGDGYLDISTNHYHWVYIFLNDGTGHFDMSYSFYGSPNMDGSWPEDLDGDGDIDLVIGKQQHEPTGFLMLENDGTGESFTMRWLYQGAPDYSDGSMSTDIDMDGLADLIGSSYRIGWIQQVSPDSFVERMADSITNSHWVYAANMDFTGDCGELDSDIDLIASADGEFAWWENQIVTYVASGWLESSVLTGGGLSAWRTFEWDDCVPDGFTVSYRVRASDSFEDIFNEPWSDPIAYSGDSLVDYGITGLKKYFQYRIEMQRTGGPADRSPILYEVRVHFDICGDANNDDALTNADLIYLASYLFLGGPAPQPLSKGDMNGDCMVTASDLTYLALYLFSGGPEPQCCGLAE